MPRGNRQLRGARLADARIGIAVTLLVSLASFGATASVEAQDRTQFQQWSGYFGTVRLSESQPAPTLWLDLHARRGPADTVLIVRPAFGFQLTPLISVWAGYAWVPVFREAASDPNEHRIWQQLILSQRPHVGVSLQARTRFEQRFSDAGSDVGFRLRQFVRANWQPTPDLPLGVAFWDELFIGLSSTDWGAPGGFDQNRVFVGPFLPLERWGRLELGYLFVFLRRNGEDRFQHALAVNLFMSLKPE